MTTSFGIFAWPSSTAWADIARVRRPRQSASTSIGWWHSDSITFWHRNPGYNPRHLGCSVPYVRPRTFQRLITTKLPYYNAALMIRWPDERGVSYQGLR